MPLAYIHSPSDDALAVAVAKRVCEAVERGTEVVIGGDPKRAARMAFLNEVCPNNNAPYLSNAAQWITPRAAHQFLKKTASCFPNRGEMQDIDHWTSKACFSRLRCLEAPPISGKTGFGCGLFAQDRLNVEPWRGFKYGHHRK